MENIENMEGEVRSFDYMMLSRLQMDCDFFLGNGLGCLKHLWADTVEEQVAKMKELYNGFKDKPEWITMQDIKEYEQKMIKIEAY